MPTVFGHIAAPIAAALALGSAGVAPMRAAQLLTSRGAAVMLSELKYIWMPLLLMGLSGFALRHSWNKK